MSYLYELRAINAVVNSENYVLNIVQFIDELTGQLFDCRSLSIIDEIESTSSKSDVFLFSKTDYWETYSGCWNGLEKRISSSVLTFRGCTDPFAKFIYVVGPNAEWRHFSLPQPLAVTLAGRRDPSLFPFHPFLSTDFDFSVIAAGEISILWKQSQRHPEMIYLNNVSGHYKPKTVKSTDLVQIANRQFGDLRRSKILAVCNDGAALYLPKVNK